MRRDSDSLPPSTLLSSEYTDGNVLGTPRASLATRPRLTAVPAAGNTAPVLERTETAVDAPPLWLLQDVPALDVRAFYDVTKRIFDFTLALIAVTVSMPLIAL